MENKNDFNLVCVKWWMMDKYWYANIAYDVFK